MEGLGWGGSALVGVLWAKTVEKYL